jgi:hypothetical protein
MPASCLRRLCEPVKTVNQKNSDHFVRIFFIFLRKVADVAQQLDVPVLKLRGDDRSNGRAIDVLRINRLTGFR